MNDQTAIPEQQLGAGPRLAALRQQRALGILEVSQRLRFSGKQLAALEAGQYDALPDMTFVRAMIRSYARYLGADPDPILQALEQERPDAVPRLMNTPSLTVPSKGISFFHEAGRSSRRWILAGLLVLAAALVAAWIWHSGAAPDAPPVGAGPDATHSEPPKPLPPEP